jgi:aldose 1-epimerase
MTPMPIPLTGTQHEISAGDYTAIVTELGANLRELRHRGEPLLISYEADELPPAAAGELLAPWPNRVDGGSYAFDGKQLQLDLSEPAAGNAIHGLTRWANWEQAEHESDRVLLRQLLHGRPGYPFCLLIEAEYRLDAETGLRVQVTARNEGSARAPYGTGSHPYLTVGAELIDECELTVPAARWLPSGDRGIPSGPAEDVGGTEFDFRSARAIGGTRLDHALTGLGRSADGLARVRLEGPQRSICLWADENYRWLQVFTGDALGPGQRRRALAVEPMTCPPNAFVTGTDLVILESGASFRSTWGIEADPGALPEPA